MTLRKIVTIDEEKCDGCGLCVPSCAEGAIRIVDGKARLLSENLCDGLGACLGDCPQDAITVEEREADPFDEHAVQEHLARLMDEEERRRSQRRPQSAPQPSPGTSPIPGNGGSGCPGSRMMHFATASGVSAGAAAPGPAGPAPGGAPGSELEQWPVQLHLVSPTAPYFRGADVLLAADCTAFAVGDFHSQLLRGRALAVACPKLDQNQDRYLEKLVAMIDEAQIDRLTVAVMEVPCCGGLVRLATEASRRALRKVPVKRILIGVRGQTLEESWL
ncbi:MAG: 4Fe-4S binding protein [Candidatus Krumholzibacteriia bacterium]